MSTKINYDKETFSKVLSKIKDLLKKGDLEIIPSLELESPKSSDDSSRFIEFYNKKVRISIEMFVDICDYEVWQIDIISMCDGRLRYRGSGIADGNDVATDLYNRYWVKAFEMKKREQTIDDYVDDLLS